MKGTCAEFVSTEEKDLLLLAYAQEHLNGSIGNVWTTGVPQTTTRNVSHTATPATTSTACV